MLIIFSSQINEKFQTNLVRKFSNLPEKYLYAKFQARSQGRGEGGGERGEESHPARLKKVKFALDIKHALFYAML